MASNARSPLLVYALGGLGEIGKNTYVLEGEKDLIMIDAGVRFPESDLPGVSYVIPDYSHLKSVAAKMRALFITHGHEDHIGGIPFLVQSLRVPVIYAPKLAAALIRHKLQDMKVKEPVKIVEYDSGTVVEAGPFKVRFFYVTHSIPDSYGIVVDTPEGRIVSTGDFKIDLTPIGPDIEINKIARIGDEGVDLLLSDSTNAEIEGYTPSEKMVIKSIHEIFDKAPGRLILSTFASNISRIQQIVEAAVSHGRVVSVVGRSMENTVATARDFGYIDIPDKSLVPVEELGHYKLSEICIICTGSQGEPMAALSRIASGEHKSLQIIPGDTVVLSSSAIPGNGVMIDRVVNKLARKGAEVLVNSVLFAVHSSGHPSRQELRIMLSLIHPKYFMPMHGEYRMLRLHGEIAVSLGVPKENVFILENGDSLELLNHSIRRGPHFSAEPIYIDGKDLNGLSTSIIQERSILKEDGLISIAVFLNSRLHRLSAPVRVMTKGMIFQDRNMVNRIAEVAGETLVRTLRHEAGKSELEAALKREVGAYVFHKIERRPIIVPVVTESSPC